MVKRSRVSVMLVAAAALLAVIAAGCGGGGSVSNTASTTSTTASSTAGDGSVVYGYDATYTGGRAAGRSANAATTATDTLVVLPEGASVPDGDPKWRPVSGAQIQFTDSNGNVVSLTTDSDGKFNPNDLATKSDDTTKGAEILKSAASDISAQPSVTVVPPSSGTFKDKRPCDADVTVAPTPSDSAPVVSIKVLPDTKQILTTEKRMFNVLALDSNGLVTRPAKDPKDVTVTWEVSPTSAGTMTSITDKPFIAVFSPAAAGSATVTVTIVSGSNTFTASSRLTIISAATLYTLSGTIKDTNGAAWPGAVINLGIPQNASGTPPIHIAAKANSSGAYSVPVPPDTTFTMVAIGSPFTEGSTTKPVVYAGTPTSYTSGAAGGSGSQDFTASANAFKPPPPPPDMQKYISSSFWGMRETLDRSFVTPDSGLGEILLMPSSSSGTIDNEGPFMRWTWEMKTASGVNTWTLLEPATGTIVPHSKVVITSSATGTYAFTMYMNPTSDIRTATSGTVTRQEGSWTLSFTGTLPDVTAWSVTATLKYYGKNDTGNYVIVRAATQQIDWASSTQQTHTVTTYKTPDGTKTLQTMDVVKTEQQCMSPSCTRVTFTGTVVKKGYQADGTAGKDMTLTLAGSVGYDGAFKFSLTNTTTDDPQNGAKIYFEKPAFPMTPTPEPPSITGTVLGYDSASTDANRTLKTVGTFTIDHDNECTLVQFPGTSSETTIKFKI